MAGQIKLLPPEVVNQIAAGEVVERPSSALKELLENSIDAGSKEITVRAAAGGIGLLEVCDNGRGMSGDQPLLALQRHATSKIRGIDDLKEIKTLGFRGEALSSIAAISRMELITRARDQQEGTRIRAEGGEVVERSSWGAPQGTMVRVQDLFFNVPVRKKFLRSQSTEAHHLRDVMERVAVIYPGIGFRYEYDGRMVWDCPAVAEWGQRVEQILGASKFKDIHAVSLEINGVTVEAFLSHPNCHRNTSSSLWFFVNGRPVQDRAMLHSVMRGYGTLLERGRYPIGLIHVKIDPKRVDVNVHPTKREVRFDRPQEVQEAIYKAVRQLLKSQPWLSLSVSTGPLPQRSERRWQVAERTAGFPTPMGEPLDSGHVEQAAIPFEGGEAPASPTVVFLGQIQATYLAFEVGGGLVLVDQHAAHERVLYEVMRARLEGQLSMPAQTLMLEEVIDLTPSEARTLYYIKDILEQVGWSIEEFGNDSCIVRSVPAWMESKDHVSALKELLGGLSESSGGLRGEDLVQDVLARLACISAVKAGKIMESSQAISLFMQLKRSKGGGLCPHGRPTVVEIPCSQIDRWFKRS